MSLILWSRNKIVPIQSGLLPGLLLLSLVACHSRHDENKDDKDPVLAQVYNKTLLKSDLEGIVTSFASREDSLNQLRSFVEHWVAEAILMHEAEQHVQKDLNLDKLVRDYRSSLILSNYEKELFAKELDTVITEQDIQSYYDTHKDQLRLRYDIVRYIFVKIPSEIEQEAVRRWWDADTLRLTPAIRRRIRSMAIYSDLSPGKWQSLDDLKKRVPGRMARKLSPGYKEAVRNNDYLYLLKVYAIAKKDELPPISFVRGQIEQIILHRRKKKLIEDKKEVLYRKEIAGENVRIFIN